MAKKATYKREILSTREEALKAAHRYLDNARETIGKTTIKYGHYTDSKYVREAAGIAYLSALKAIDSYLLGKGIHHDQLPKSIEEYWAALKKHIPLNGKLSADFNTVYQNLHLGAYYKEFTNVTVVKEGFKSCKKIINILDKTK